jgi:hypothetical protein
MLVTVHEVYGLIRVELSERPTFSRFLDFAEPVRPNPRSHSELHIWNVPQIYKNVSFLKLVTFRASLDVCLISRKPRGSNRLRTALCGLASNSEYLAVSPLHVHNRLFEQPDALELVMV